MRYWLLPESLASWTTWPKETRTLGTKMRIFRRRFVATSRTRIVKPELGNSGSFGSGFWILPERCVPVPLDKGNEVSGHEIAWFDPYLTNYLPTATWILSNNSRKALSQWYVYPRTHIPSDMCIPSNMAASDMCIPHPPSHQSHNMFVMCHTRKLMF